MQTKTPKAGGGILKAPTSFEQAAASQANEVAAEAQIVSEDSEDERERMRRNQPSVLESIH